MTLFKVYPKLMAGLIITNSIFLTGCSDPKIDTSTIESTRSSIQAVESKLEGDKLEKFKSAILVVMFKDATISTLANAPDLAQAQAMADINGMTADQVILKAKQILVQREKDQVSQAKQEVDDLEAEKIRADQDEAERKKFFVQQSRFGMESDGNPYSPQKVPVIRLEVENKTGQTISAASFVGTISSPGRAVPWFVDNFAYKIPGGLENGEHAKWVLAPNMFSKWGRIDAPTDAIFTVEVQYLYDAKGNQIFDSKFSDEDQKRLDALKEFLKGKEPPRSPSSNQ